MKNTTLFLLLLFSIISVATLAVAETSKYMRVDPDGTTVQVGEEDMSGIDSRCTNPCPNPCGEKFDCRYHCNKYCPVGPKGDKLRAECYFACERSKKNTTANTSTTAPY